MGAAPVMNKVRAVFVLLILAIVGSWCFVAQADKKKPTKDEQAAACHEALHACMENADNYFAIGPSTPTTIDTYGHMLNLCKSNFRQCTKDISRAPGTQGTANVPPNGTMAPPRTWQRQPNAPATGGVSPN